VDELTSENVPLENGNILSDGVECTADGLPVAYWITQTDVDGFTIAEPQRIPAENAIFLWDRTRVSQFREITPMASTIVTTKDVGDYNNAVAFQQKTAACTSAFVETTSTAGAMGRMAAMEQQKSKIEQIKGGRVQYLNPGETVKMLIPSGQAAEVGNYLPLQQRMIAAAMGLSLESTSRNVERVNYSSARQNLLADENTYKQMRKDLIEYFLRPLYRRFVSICYLAGLLDGTGFKPDDLQYYKAVWLAPSLGWIDPKKEAEANSINLQNGGLSFQQYCAAQGVDWRERIDEMAEVQEYAESKGVTLSFNVADSSDVQGDDDTDGEN
jgi:lambda family phage portal protein